MREDQVFIHGNDLKADLARLDAHYSALPDEVKVMNPAWRDWGSGLKPSGGEEKAAIDEIVEMDDAPRVGREFTLDEAQAVLFKRSVPIRKGKWTLVPPEVTEG